MRYPAADRVRRQLPPTGPPDGGTMSPAASLIIIVALLAALLYFDVSRTGAPTLQSEAPVTTQSHDD